MIAVSVWIGLVVPAVAQTIGVLTPLHSTITQGGYPNYADTYVTPYVFTTSGSVLRWKGNFPPGYFSDPQIDPGVPASIQLKVFRKDPDGNFIAISAGQSHDPRPPLQSLFPGYPIFLTDTGIVEFTELSVSFEAGDYLGLTIRSDPQIGAYFYTLVAGSNTRIVLRDVPLAGVIEAADPFTGTLFGEVPAVQITSAEVIVNIDIKPGSYPNAINLGSAGVVPVAILSSPDFDATTIDPSTLRLAGAAVGMVGKSSKLLCSSSDINSDERVDLVCQFTTAEIALQTGDAVAVVVGKTYTNLQIKGQDSVKIVP
jgi:hypothetical protein